MRRQNNNRSNRRGPFRPQKRFQPQRGGKRVIKLDPSLFLNRANGAISNENYLSETLFASFPLEEKVKRNILDHGYTYATQI